MVGPNLPVGTRVRILKTYEFQRRPPSELGTIAEHRPSNRGYLVKCDDGQGPFGWGYSELALVDGAPEVGDDWDDWPLGPPDD